MHCLIPPHDDVSGLNPGLVESFLREHPEVVPYLNQVPGLAMEYFRCPVIVEAEMHTSPLGRLTVCAVVRTVLPMIQAAVRFKKLQEEWFTVIRPEGDLWSAPVDIDYRCVGD